MNITKIFKEVLKYRKVLDDIFYGDGLLMKGFPQFFKAVRNEQHDIPFSVLKYYYENQAVVQIFKPPEKLDFHRPIISLLPFGRVYCDTMYLTLKNSVLGFINIIDLFSKYGFSKVYVLKSETSSISSEKAKIAFNEFLNEIKPFNIDIGIVYTDRGSEFLGDFMKDLEEKKIVHVYGNAGDKRKTSPIERFNKTMRLMVEKYRVVYGKVNSNIIKKLITSYNKIPHANLKHSPINILNSKSIQDEVTTNNYNIQKNIVKIPPISGYVRLLITKTFKKVSPQWTTEIYKIKNFSNGNYSLEELPNQYFKRDELQSVNKDHLMKKTIRIMDTDEIKDDDDIKEIVREEPIYNRRLPKVEFEPIKKKEKNSIEVIKKYLEGKLMTFERKDYKIDKVVYSYTYKNYLVEFNNEEALLYEVLESNRRKDWFKEHKDIFEEIIKKYNK